MRLGIGSVSAVALLTLIGCGRSAVEHTADSPGPAPSAESAAMFKPVATVKQIMQGITIPASNTVFAVAGETPADDAAWHAVEVSALAVAESGNLLLMKPRAVDEGDWRQFTTALIDAAARAAEAARSKDAEKASLAGDDLYNTCEQCHAKYLPKPQ